MEEEILNWQAVKSEERRRKEAPKVLVIAESDSPGNRYKNCECVNCSRVIQFQVLLSCQEEIMRLYYVLEKRTFATNMLLCHLQL